jgi:hypothetical protein
MLRRYAVAILAFGLAAPIYAQFTGPVSTYFLTAGDQRTISIIQGTTSVTLPMADINSHEYPIVVLGNGIRTTPANGGSIGYGYNLNGTPNGQLYTLSAGIVAAYDGTTDGTYNYVADYSAGTVFRTNLDFSGAVSLFGGFGTGAFLGITYDPTNNSLWVSGWNTSLVTNYTMSGTVISSFSAVTNSLSSLALDHATGTLWMGSQNTQGTFYQYSKTGTLLQTAVYSGLVSQNTLGGEFAFAAIPEPTTASLGLLGTIFLWVTKRRRSKKLG